MGLKTSQWVVLMCFCAFGIQNSQSFIQNMREIEQNCARDGGYCIHVIPPQPKKRPMKRGGKRGRMGTRTRKGSRPDPRALGAQHTRLPASAQGAAAGGAGGHGVTGAGASVPSWGMQGTTLAPTYQQPGAMSSTSQQSMFNDPFSLFGMMMFTRKKRQVPEPHERPRIRQGQDMFGFLNQHCRKSEFDFGCRRNGGMCCLPFLR